MGTEPYSLWQIILLIFLLSCSAFFSMSETALMTLSKIRLRHMIEEKVKNADIIEKVLSNPNRLLATILVGNNAVNIGASALGTVIALNIFGSSGVAVATGVMTILVLMFGEITPKSLAAQYSEQISLVVSKPIYFLIWILKPVVQIFTGITNAIVVLFGGRLDKQTPIITEEELRTIVSVSHEEGVLEVEEKQMIHNVFEFGESQIRDIMVQRTDVVAISVDTSYEEVMNIIKQEQFSRYPVYRETRDNILGIMNVKDLVILDNAENDFDLESLVRQPYFTYEFKKNTDIFKEMKKNRIPMAIVLDEYGGMVGIVTMEDLIEEIVGEIEDEYDEEEQEIEVIKEDEYLIEGSARLDLVNEMIGVNLESEDVDSLGGFLIDQLGRFPEQEETIEYNNIKFIVESVNNNRINKIRVLT